MQFDIVIRDAMGDLAHVADILAKSHVKIRAASAERGERAILHITVDENPSIREALKNAGIEFSERDISIVALAHSPGELIKEASRLADNRSRMVSPFAPGYVSMGNYAAIEADGQVEVDRLISSP